MPTQVSLLDGALASAGTLAIQTNGTTSAITISSAQVATFVNNPIMTGLTASRAVFTDGSKGLTSNAITGTGNVVMSASPTLTGTIDGAALTLSSSLTLSGGTANGVLYLNGSKVATSGSALTFNGSDMAIGGTNTNSARLALVDNSSNNYSSALDFRQTYASTVYSRVYANFGGTLALSADVGNAASGTSDIWFYLSGSEKMRLTSTGLGIGTSSPTQSLDVNGNAILRLASATTSRTLAFTTSSGVDGWTIGNGVIASANQFVIYSNTAGAARMLIDSSGNLGIGTSSPNSLLTVQNGNILLRSAVTTGALSSYNLGFSATATGGAAAYITSYRENANEASALVFGTWNGSASAERARIDSSGNLLVGTTAANAGSRLRVKTSGTTNATYGIFVANNANAEMFSIEDDGRWCTGATTTSPYNNTTATAANMVVTSSGFLQRSTSSLKYKKNVVDAVHGLSDLMKLRSVTYEGKAESDSGKTFGGLIAEEVDAAGLTEFVQYAEDGTPDALAYGNMVSLCIKAIQEQQAIIVELKARLDAANL